MTKERVARSNRDRLLRQVSNGDNGTRRDETALARAVSIVENHRAGFDEAMAFLGASAEARETARRLLIRVRLAQGNHVEAIRAYRQYVALLRTEFGVAPSPIAELRTRLPDMASDRPALFTPLGLFGLAEIGNISWDSSYLQLFPTAFLNYKIKEDQTVGLSVSRRIDRPGYSQLNPFLFLIDVTTYATGNPGLLPQLPSCSPPFRIEP